ncbi:MAG: alpha-amylase family glycosyl hydrolase [Bacillota bacterium]|nr:alpha-amylase family glycosyl hydrolase [Bacillota bacterium]
MPKWLRNAVFYEIYPQSFYDSNDDGIGDIQGIIEKLDYIKDLGCNALWLNPVFDSPFMDAGYDVRDYKNVAQRYGTNEDLIRLFEVAHEKGIKVLLDLIPGHTSDTHKWFLQSREAENNELTDRYIWTESVWEAPPQYRLMCGISPRDGNYLVNFFSSQPALNYGFHEITHPKWQKPADDTVCIATREALKDMMRFWLSRGCDGFRVDMADSLVKNDEEKISTMKIWKNIRKMMDAEYPEAALVAEWCTPTRALKCGFHADFYLDHEGNGYNTLFRFHDKETGEDKSFFSKNGLGDITLFTKEYLPNLEATKNDGFISFITCNHDTPRMSRNYSKRELELAFCTIFTLPGVPFLYYGDEIGMRFIEGLNSKEGAYSRTGTRTPMQWGGGKNLGFSDAEKEELYLPVDDSEDAPTVASQENRPDSLLNTVKTVIKIRNENEDLWADGDFEVLYAKKAKYPFVFKRGKFIIVVNPSLQEVTAPFDYSGKVVFSIGVGCVENKKILLMPQTFAIIEVD